VDNYEGEGEKKVICFSNKTLTTRKALSRRLVLEGGV